VKYCVSPARGLEHLPAHLETGEKASLPPRARVSVSIFVEWGASTESSLGPPELPNTSHGFSDVVQRLSADVRDGCIFPWIVTTQNEGSSTHCQVKALLY